MDGKPVNLRQHRKRKAREAKAEEAAANRVLHGTPKALTELEAARKAKAEALLEGHKREGENEGENEGEDEGGDAGK